jgi:hypothetical protein
MVAQAIRHAMARAVRIVLIPPGGKTNEFSQVCRCVAELRVAIGSYGLETIPRVTIELYLGCGSGWPVTTGD